MPILETSWLPVAQALGFESEKQMLQQLYEEAGFSLKELEHVIGFSYITVRRRLMDCGIKLRGRGGAHKVKRRKLLAVPDAELKFTPPNELALHYKVHLSTVFSEKRLRKRTKGEVAWDAVLKPIEPPDELCTSAQSLQSNISTGSASQLRGTSSLPNGSSEAQPTSPSTEDEWPLDNLF